MKLQVKEVEFNSKKIKVVKKNDKIYVSVRSICNNLRMNKKQYVFQRNKVNKDGLLKGGIKLFPLETNGGIQKVMVLELDYLPIWLAKINPSRFSDELKKELMNYQLNAKDVLADAFLGHRTKRIVTKPLSISIPQVMIPIGKSIYWEELKKLSGTANSLRTDVYNRIMSINHDILMLSDDVDNLRDIAKKVGELVERIEK